MDSSPLFQNFFHLFLTLLLIIVFNLLCINKNNNKRKNTMTQIDFNALSDLSPFQLTQYIDDHHFTSEQKVLIFEHYHSTHKDTTNIYSRKENIKSIKKDVDYVHMFTKNFQQLAELDISKNELKVIARILNIMEFGNCFHISQAKLCRDLDIKNQTCLLFLKSLKRKGTLLIRTETFL